MLTCATRNGILKSSSASTINSSMDPQALYVFSTGTSVKVGISKYPRKRFTQLRKTHKELEKIVFVSERFRNSIWIERCAHNALSEYLIPGEREWFRCAPEIAVDIVKNLLSNLTLLTEDVPVPTIDRMDWRELRKYLKDARYSQREMAAVLGIAERTMRAYVLDEDPVPISIALAVKFVCKHMSSEEFDARVKARKLENQEMRVDDGRARRYL